MARPGYVAEDTAARNASQNRVSPSQALTVASGAKPPVPVQAQNAAAPTAPKALPAPARPILTLPSGNIPSAQARIQGPASNALNAINGSGAFVPGAPPPPPKPVMAGAPPVPSTAPLVAAAAAPGVPPPQPSAYAQQVNSNIVQQAKQRASIAASGATAPTGAPVVSPAPAQAPRLASMVLNDVKAAGSTALKYGSKALAGAGRIAPVVAAGAEAASAYNDATTEGMTGIDQAARGAEGVGRAAGAFAGAGLGAGVGTAGGPFAPLTVPVGGIVGGIAGLFAPEAVNEASNRMFGTDTQLASQKAAQLRQGYQGSGLPHSPAQLASGAFPEEAAREIPTITGGVPWQAVQAAQAQRAWPAAGLPASAALANAQAPKPASQPAQQTRSPGQYAEISGYDGPKKNVNRRYSYEELMKLGERNVIPSASFTNPGAGVALSKASGGRFNLGSPTPGKAEAYLIDGNGKEYAAGQTSGGSVNPITQYRNEVSAAQAQNQATNDRATAIINARPDETTQRLMSGAERALSAGQKLKAAGFIDLLQAYNGSKPSDAMNRQQQAKKPTPDEEALAAIQRQKEQANADILGVQAGQAKQVAELQAALLSAPPEEQASIKAQLDTVMGRNTPQAKPQPGAITPAMQFENERKLAENMSLTPEARDELRKKQAALSNPPPVPGAQIGNDGNWYVVQNGQMMMVSP